jgi:hypothetical protein
MVALLMFGAALSLIGIVLNDPPSALTREPVPQIGHVNQLLF